MAKRVAAYMHKKPTSNAFSYERTTRNIEKNKYFEDREKENRKKRTKRTNESTKKKIQIVFNNSK